MKKTYPKIHLEVKCPRLDCKKNAIIDPTLGVLPCSYCISKDNVTITKLPEFTSLNKMHRVQHQRDKGARDLIQPYIGNAINPNFAKAYPKQAKKYYTRKELESL